MEEQKEKQRHDRQMQGRKNRLELFNQTFNRVLWLDAAVLGAIVAALQNEDTRTLVGKSTAAQCWLTAAVVGLAVSLTATLVIPIFRAWWSVKYPGKLST